MDILYQPIGIVRTPYSDMAPFQADENDSAGEFCLELFPEFETGLRDLEEFLYVVVLFHIDRAKGYNGSNLAHPPSLSGGSVGLFASRSPNRPNTIGLDVTKLLRIDGRKVYTGGLSILDGTPLLDIKPYISADRKDGPLGGWGRLGGDGIHRKSR